MSVYRSRITSWQSAASLPHRILEILRSAISKTGSLGKTGRHYWFKSFFLLTAFHLDLILSFYICQRLCFKATQAFLWFTAKYFMWIPLCFALCSIYSRTKYSIYFAHYFRWIKLRSAMVPHTALLEPISECMLSGALASLASYILFRTDPVCFYLVHILVWFICDWLLIHIVQVNIILFCTCLQQENLGINLMSGISDIFELMNLY